MGHIDAVLFDLDGTLADTLADIGAALNRTLAELTLPQRSPAEIARMVGDGMRKLVERAVPPALVEDAIAGFRRHYSAALVVETRLYDGIPALLDGLTARRVPMAVLSNKPHAMTVAIAEALLGAWPIAPVFGHRDAAPRKPDPHSALEIASTLGVAPARVAFVGDTAVDVRTALAAAMQPFGVAWGFRQPAELRAAGAPVILDEPLQLLACL